MHGRNFTIPKKSIATNMLAKWNVHNEQVLRMMKKAVSFRPIVDIKIYYGEHLRYSG